MGLRRSLEEYKQLSTIVCKQQRCGADAKQTDNWFTVFAKAGTWCLILFHLYAVREIENAHRQREHIRICNHIRIALVQSNGCVSMYAAIDSTAVAGRQTLRCMRMGISRTLSALSSWFFKIFHRFLSAPRLCAYFLAYELLFYHICVQTT